MLKKLKLRFILISMLLVFAVLAAALTAIFLFRSNALARDGARALAAALSQDRFSPPKTEVGRPSRGERPQDGLPLNNIFNVEVAGSGEYVLYSGNTTIDADTLDAAVRAALDSEESSGRVEGFGLDFMKKPTPSGTRISFRDLSDDRASLRSLAVSLAVAGLGALAAFFLICLYLAGLALRPVENSWEQQRRFVADAAHELRSPLAVIRANLDLLPGAGSRPLEYVRQEEERLERLAADLLFLARADAPDDSAALVPLDFGDLVWGCVLPFEPLAFDMKKSLSSHIAAEVFVRGDGERLRRLVTVLLDNACRHSDEGCVIEISLDVFQDSARLRVRNSGEPIPPEQLPHLFERFYRADRARSRADGGAGLGLAIAKSVCDLHGGRISAASSADSGTEFTVLLPLLHRKGGA